MPSPVTLRIPDELDGAAVGSALKRLLPDRSWSHLKELIARRHVQVNGTLAVEEGRRVKAGDIVDLFPRPLPPPPGERDVRLVHMDKHMVVIDKPAGIVTQRHLAERDWSAERKAKQPALEEVVQRLVDQNWNPGARAAGAPSAGAGGAPADRRVRHPIFGKKAGAGGKGGRKGEVPSPRGAGPRQAGPHARGGPARGPRGAPPGGPGSVPWHQQAPRPPRVRAVHRLDRDTSGLMVFALSPAAEEALVRMFKRHAIDRTYLAVVHGHPAAQTIESWLVRDRGDGLRGSAPRGKDDPAGERAVTHLEPVERVGDYSVVRCRLETGRTHQIRIHLAEIGHMLCGERVYTHKVGEEPNLDASGAPRQALHSAELRMLHPSSGARVEYRSPWPPELKEWLDELRGRAGK